MVYPHHHGGMQGGAKRDAKWKPKLQNVITGINNALKTCNLEAVITVKAMN